MAEYLEREGLLRELRLWNLHKAEPDNFHYTELKAWLEALPAEDVQPVKHGRWIDGDCRCVTAVCSNCNRLRLGNGAKSAMRLALYCEKCGARMDGET